VDLGNRSAGLATRTAARHGHLDVFEYLQACQHSALRSTESGYVECLELAILGRYPDLVKHLLPFATSGNIHSPLKCALRANDVELAQLLVTGDESEWDFASYLALAIASCCERMVLWMMESPKRKNIRLEVLSKAMLIAGRYGCIRIVRIVFGDLSEAQRTDVAGQSLGQAIREGNRDLVDLFAAYGFGSDDLCLAVEKSGLEIVRTMLSRDSSPALLNGMNADMSTPLTLAAQYLKEDIAVFLLAFPGIDPSRHDRSHMTPLLYAASRGNYAITKAILDCYGSAVCGRIPEVNRAIRKAMRFSISTGQTADQQVRLKSKMDILLALLSVRGVDVNPIAKSETLLQCAARSGSAELVRELLKYPETDVNDFSDGGTALIFALEGGFDDVSLMLIECDRVDLNYRHQKKGTVVQVAAQKGHAPVLKALITSQRFDPNRHELSYILELAICQNRIEIC
jgi:ankyrin repeat protein